MPLPGVLRLPELGGATGRRLPVLPRRGPRRHGAGTTLTPGQRILSRRLALLVVLILLVLVVVVFVMLVLPSPTGPATGL
jgi:hypothetical protein